MKFLPVSFSDRANRNVVAINSGRMENINKVFWFSHGKTYYRYIRDGRFDNGTPAKFKSNYVYRFYERNDQYFTINEGFFTNILESRIKPVEIIASGQLCFNYIFSPFTDVGSIGYSFADAGLTYGQSADLKKTVPATSEDKQLEIYKKAYEKYYNRFAKVDPKAHKLLRELAILGNESLISYDLTLWDRANVQTLSLFYQRAIRVLKNLKSKKNKRVNYNFYNSMKSVFGSRAMMHALIQKIGFNSVYLKYIFHKRDSSTCLYYLDRYFFPNILKLKRGSQVNILACRKIKFEDTDFPVQKEPTWRYHQFENELQTWSSAMASSRNSSLNISVDERQKARSVAASRKDVSQARFCNEDVELFDDYSVPLRSAPLLAHPYKPQPKPKPKPRKRETIGRKSPKHWHRNGWF